MRLLRSGVRVWGEGDGVREREADEKASSRMARGALGSDEGDGCMKGKFAWRWPGMELSGSWIAVGWLECEGGVKRHYSLCWQPIVCS